MSEWDLRAASNQINIRRRNLVLRVSGRELAMLGDESFQSGIGMFRRWVVSRK
jgi:hypothetical protein